MRMRIPGILAAGALAAAIACASGCGKKQEIVKIGAILPLAGAEAELGNQYLHGMTLAIEELNGAGSGVVYELVADDGSDAARAGGAFSRQLTTHKVAAVVTATDAAAIGAGSKAEQQFVPLFANCDHPFVITMFRDVFRNSPATMHLIRRTFAFLSGQLKAKNVALLYADDPAGKLVAQAIKDDILSTALTLGASEPYDASGADSRSPAAAILAQKPDAVLVLGGGSPAARAIAALRRLGFRGPVCGSLEIASPAVIAAAPEAVEGCYVAVPAMELVSELPLAERYRARFNAEPTPNVLYAYDAMMIIAKADRARRYEESSLTNALKKIGDYNGIAGTYSYSEREWQPPVHMTQIRGGIPVAVR